MAAVVPTVVTVSIGIEPGHLPGSDPVCSYAAGNVAGSTFDAGTDSDSRNGLRVGAESVGGPCRTPERSLAGEPARRYVPAACAQRRRVADGLTPNSRRYAAAKRPRCMKPHRVAPSATVSTRSCNKSSCTRRNRIRRSASVGVSPR